MPPAWHASARTLTCWPAPCILQTLASAVRLPTATPCRVCTGQPPHVGCPVATMQCLPHVSFGASSQPSAHHMAHPQTQASAPAPNLGSIGPRTARRATRPGRRSAAGRHQAAGAARPTGCRPRPPAPTRSPRGRPARQQPSLHWLYEDVLGFRVSSSSPPGCCCAAY